MRLRIRGFTLIELLVVIAIIAILAAILFPVFAQAKIAGKAAASISNSKQVSLAIIQYSTDYDDYPPIVGNNDADAPFLLNGIPYKPWSYLLMPYSKSGMIWQDPLTKPEPVPAGWDNNTLWTYRTQIGYAYTIHAPVNLTTGWIYSATSQTALNKPAETVILSIKKARNNNGDWLWVGSLIWGANNIWPPVCNGFFTPPQVIPLSVCPASSIGPCGWGDGCPSYPGQTYEEGVVTGGVALRKMQLTVVSFADGHVKTSPPSWLAQGTNWTPTTLNTSMVITDIDKYLWDAN